MIGIAGGGPAMALAKLPAGAIDLVVRTGGSSLIPAAVRGLLEARFPGRVVEHHPFTSVAVGLVIADYLHQRPPLRGLGSTAAAPRLGINGRRSAAWDYLYQRPPLPGLGLSLSTAAAPRLGWNHPVLNRSNQRLSDRP